MALVGQLSAPSIELWARLARAAAGKRCWSVTRECADSACGSLPNELRGGGVAVAQTAAAAPALTREEWFWLAVVELQRGEAVLASIRPQSHDAAAHVQLRLAAAANFVAAARLAGGGFARRRDLCETSCRRLAEAVSGPPLAHPAARSLLSAPLAAAAAALNGDLRGGDVEFAASFNSLLVDCLCAAGRWGDALAHCQGLRRSAPGLLTRRVLVARAAACLARVGGSRVGEEMARLLADIVLPEIKASTLSSAVLLVAMLIACHLRRV
jgi:hypothetical protein